ncbi:alcohol dehydrogenase catalytic domain-containing protein [Halocatena marina]|uniref:Alcohol dehydrogenase catalytic domain-containing protein n=1 Tax=Halocatena marina TaxID=2934937 RepID=A0ABD5YJA1_9EURY
MGRKISNSENTPFRNQADAVVIKIERTNVCDSELHVWRDDHPLSSCILAHEAICRVSNFGEKVDTDGVGQQISEGDLFAPRDFQTCQQ